ncbi:MAG TPA: hypothetical protein VJR58_05375 [Vineibacter sp.]|nr:hypothetical protein [Vineibacter sp.]
MATHPRTDASEQTPATVSPDEARSGVKLNVMRYVLATSLAAVIVGMVCAWLYFA